MRFNELEQNELTLIHHRSRLGREFSTSICVRRFSILSSLERQRSFHPINLQLFQSFALRDANELINVNFPLLAAIWFAHPHPHSQSFRRENYRLLRLVSFFSFFRVKPSDKIAKLRLQARARNSAWRLVSR